MLLLLLLDRFPVPCTEPNDLILNRFLLGKYFVVKFALLYLSFVGHISLACGPSAILFTNWNSFINLHLFSSVLHIFLSR